MTKIKVVDHDTDIISIVWHISDVQSLDPSIDDDDARAILEMVKNNHNASLGVNWDVLRENIRMYFND